MEYLLKISLKYTKTYATKNARRERRARVAAKLKLYQTNTTKIVTKDLVHEHNFFEVP
jgi:hypothetical protein